MAVRKHIIISDDVHGAPPWLITFCDLVFLLLAFFVLKFSMSAPRQVKLANTQSAAVVRPIEKIAGGEETSILGVFSPSDSSVLSFRGKTALSSLAKQASELGQDVVVSLEIISFPKEKSQDAQGVKELLYAQREAVLRQLVDSGLSLEGLLVEPINLPKPDWFSVTTEDKSLSSRVTLILQEKRS
jgi:flagellar motor protein MotB